MHFSKATIVLCAGSAAAVPLSIGVGAGSTSTSGVTGGVGVSSGGTVTLGGSAGLLGTGIGAGVCFSLFGTCSGSSSSGSTSSGSTGTGTGSGTATTPTPSPSISINYSNIIIDDLNALDTAMQSALTALNGFTGGSNINNQAYAVSQAGDLWQSAILKLLTDSKNLAGKGQFSAADSTRIANLINGAVASDFAKVYNSIASKKALFTQIGGKTSVRDGLNGISTELKAICDALVPLLLSGDYPTVQNAANQIFPASSNAINTYSS